MEKTPRWNVHLFRVRIYPTKETAYMASMPSHKGTGPAPALAQPWPWPGPAWPGPGPLPEILNLARKFIKIDPNLALVMSIFPGANFEKCSP